MVRVNDPLLPRAVFGVLNTLLYFPSGAVYPPQGFPRWMQVLAVVDPLPACLCSDCNGRRDDVVQAVALTG